MLESYTRMIATREHMRNILPAYGLYARYLCLWDSMVWFTTLSHMGRHYALGKSLLLCQFLTQASSAPRQKCYDHFPKIYARNALNDFCVHRMISEVLSETYLYNDKTGILLTNPV